MPRVQAMGERAKSRNDHSGDTASHPLSFQSEHRQVDVWLQRRRGSVYPRVSPQGLRPVQVPTDVPERVSLLPFIVVTPPPPSPRPSCSGVVETATTPSRTTRRLPAKKVEEKVEVGAADIQSTANCADADVHTIPISISRD
ncbi:hypothetical protein MSAN_02117100 [Mycena sanguinolenta]|uniref:Uncharacterized protein n=1 Tax=Mycena sanguinolenta TaxID=230812 RepID=A0A8H6XI20_9AGAR|nr:hypothetical protein MSAN_02117100 [Mycena sanguinolenta]